MGNNWGNGGYGTGQYNWDQGWYGYGGANCNPCNNVFQQLSEYIKTQNGDFVAILGDTTIERLICSPMRIPYKQVLSGRIRLKAGQVNYLFNFLGLGDNATFVAIKANYDPRSTNEPNNYVNYNYYNDFSNIYAMDELLILTGNTTNRIQQLYLTNPNGNYDVTLEVLVAVKDDTYSYFPDIINQSGTSFVGLQYTDIQTYVVNESIVINNNGTPVGPLIYITLASINSMQRSGQVLIIDDETIGQLFLQFSTLYDAEQAQSLISYVLNNRNIVIQNLNPIYDNIPPTVYFYQNIGNTASGYTISCSATSSLPTNSTMGYTFSTSMSLSTYGTNSTISVTTLLDLIVATVSDNRDGIISVTASDVILYGTMSNVVSIVTSTGTYSLSFNTVSDIAQNFVTASVYFTITT